jgi:hypothetical protein
MNNQSANDYVCDITCWLSQNNHTLNKTIIFKKKSECKKMTRTRKLADFFTFDEQFI